MIEVCLPPEVVAARLEQAAAEGSLSHLIERVSGARVDCTSWELKVWGDSGGNGGSECAEFVMTELLGGEGSRLEALVPDSGDSPGWRRAVEAAIWQDLVGMMADGFADP